MNFYYKQMQPCETLNLRDKHDRTLAKQYLPGQVLMQAWQIKQQHYHFSESVLLHWKSNYFYHFLKYDSLSLLFLCTKLHLHPHRHNTKQPDMKIRTTRF